MVRWIVQIGRAETLHVVGFDRPRFFSVVRPEEGVQYHREQGEFRRKLVKHILIPENGEVEVTNAWAWRAWL